MSHSPTEIERSWDFGMVDTDIVAFPVCVAVDEKYWSSGKLSQNASASYWHERDWVKWELQGHINYFSVAAFRAVPFQNVGRKGVTEGSELTIGWPAIFATYDGTVVRVDEARILIRRARDQRGFSRAIRQGQRAAVAAEERVSLHQVIAAAVAALPANVLDCPGHLPEQHITHLLASRERTQRFTGVKLARLRRERNFADAVTALVRDAEEDIYVKLEGVSYLSAVCEQPIADNIRPYLTNNDPQIALEAVITLGETAAREAGDLLCAILDDGNLPYFMRSAAAWGLARQGGEASIRRLIRAFSDVNTDIRQEALDSIVVLGGRAIPLLLATLREAGDDSLSAGSAEALRQLSHMPEFPARELIQMVEDRPASTWPVWLTGMVPRDRIAQGVAQLQEAHPELHYAVTVLWSFIESWIAKKWELRPQAEFEEGQA
jgi:HEAT repeat protein